MGIVLPGACVRVCVCVCGRVCELETIQGAMHTLKKNVVSSDRASAARVDRGIASCRDLLE